MIDTIIEAGITPLVTLFHWDLPQALENAYLGKEQRCLLFTIYCLLFLL